MAGTIVGEFNNAWKGRGTLRQLVEELNRQRESRVDVVIDTRDLELGYDAATGEILLMPRISRAREWFEAETPFERPALGQLLGSLNPPVGVALADSCRTVGIEQAKVFAQFAGDLFDQTGKRRFVRMLDGKIRGWLSDRYRVYDNYDLAFQALAVARDHGGEVIEAALTERQMRIKLTSRTVYETIVDKQDGPRGDWFAGGLGNQEYLSKVGARSQGELPGGPGAVHPIVTVSNSETGHGGLAVRFGLLLGWCYNVATVEDVVREIHLGERLEPGLFSAEAIAADSAAIMLKARDAIAAAFDPDRFARLVAKAREAQNDVIAAPFAAVDALVTAQAVPQASRDDLLAYFCRDYTPTRWGLAQAVSRLAQDTDDGDVAIGLENAAGRILVGAHS